ncbi:MAG: FAD-binding protein [Polyangiaceae bacterium]|nr:FAD-binding protein [Polyangiaceae bacterium]
MADDVQKDADVAGGRDRGSRNPGIARLSAGRVVVVGSGIAGLMAAIRLCEAGIPVDIVSLDVGRRSSVCARDGINAAFGTGSGGDSPRLHFEDTIRGGDYLAHQPLVMGMVEAAPQLVHLLERMGVPFDRTAEGLLRLRQLSGSLCARTAFSGDTIGLQVVSVLDEQVRRYEAEAVVGGGGVVVREPMVRRFEGWEFLRLVLDDEGRCVGIVGQDMRTMEVRAFRGDAVCLATGGYGGLFGRYSGSGVGVGVARLGAAVSRVFQQGAVFANGEFVQMHPASVVGVHSSHCVSESVCAEGGRYWVPTDISDTRAPHLIPTRERDYFLERMYPGLGNLVPLDLAARAVYQVCVHGGRGFFDKGSGNNDLAVYLDVSHLPERHLRRQLGGELDAYQKRTGVNPCNHPMKVSLAAHYCMGGVWVDYECGVDGSILVGSPRNHATSIPGLYAVGEVEYGYHGASLIGGNSLLSCLYGGTLVAPAIAGYVDSLGVRSADVGVGVFEAAEAMERDEFVRVLGQNREEKSDKKVESVWRLRGELSDVMFGSCGGERDDESLRMALDRIGVLAEKLKQVRVDDVGRCWNQSVQAVRAMDSMVVLARLVVESALYRTESRGAHCRVEHGGGSKGGGSEGGRSSGRDDSGWLRSTLARCGDGGRVEFVRSFSYDCAGERVSVKDDVDTSLVAVGDRGYDVVVSGCGGARGGGESGATVNESRGLS